MRFFWVLKHCKGRKDLGAVALTFDDGPSLWTEKVLDVLKEYRVNATFFLIPENIKRLPAVAQRIIAEGHEIGAHVAQPESFGHVSLRALMGKASEEKIKKSIEVPHRILGRQPRFFRPSSELVNNRGTEELLKKLGLTPVIGFAASRVTKPPHVQAREIIWKIKSGAIILVHDGHDLKINSDRPKDTLQILPTIIGAVRVKNLKFATVSELLGVPAYR